MTHGETIRVRGTVQGVGFRPTVWRLARELSLRGTVRNDAEGVLIEAWGGVADLDGFVLRLRQEAPPLARIEAVERRPLESEAPQGAFRILASVGGDAATAVAADAATCPECLAEVFDPASRRYRYPFTNCTHCGPRLSIIRAIPYDRANTSMAAFAQCPACEEEYGAPHDRRFHAQPNACPECGPRVWLEDADAVRLSSGSDPIDLAAKLLREGNIVAIKGIGGFHLACDAANEAAVAALRQRKQRYHKAFALMARDLAMVRRYARVEEAEAELLHSRSAPIVILDTAGEALAAEVAPGQRTLAFMLPYTPLHHLLLAALERPIVLTSGNRSDEPQAIDNDDARRRLAGIADYWLLHDREIVNRLDDSVARIADGAPRLLRRARGYAPAPLPLAEGFAAARPVLAMGGELKNSFCLLQRGRAILSQHMGDLENAASQRDYRHNLALYRQLFEHRPAAIGVDLHPNYHSTLLGREWAAEEGVPLIAVQHHHAHIAACMAEHGRALDGGPVLGVALDGLGMGENGELWGGEFLLADYRGFTRLGRFDAVPLPGGNRASVEPWRNAVAHLQRVIGWEAVAARYPGLPLLQQVGAERIAPLLQMVEQGINSPRASSCGRLFDAAAALLGICTTAVSHEGQAAIEMEALAQPQFQAQREEGYRPGEQSADGLITLVWEELWLRLLHDLQGGVERAVIAARFHQGLAAGVASLALRLAASHPVDTVVLAGGVFQNRLLLEGVAQRCRERGLNVFAPQQVPANDGGISLGQAVVAAARLGAGEGMPTPAV
jgi:hydrogenase maturation protein HypF